MLSKVFVAYAAIYLGVILSLSLIQSSTAVSDAFRYIPASGLQTCPTNQTKCNANLGSTALTWCSDQASCCGCQKGTDDTTCYSCVNSDNCSWKPGAGYWCMTTLEIVGIAIGICVAGILVIAGLIFLVSSLIKCCKSGKASKNDVSKFHG